MMTEGTTTPLLARAVRQHFADIDEVQGVQAFVGQGGDWTEATRRGDVPAELHRHVLAGFKPDAGGAVSALQDRGGWLATYMMGGPGVDLVLIVILGPLSPADLPQRLDTIEAKVGWLMVAALADRRDAGESRAIGSEIGAHLLLDAASARSRRMLADQWIARLETALQPDLVSVMWVRNGAPKLDAVSGGGLIERPTEARGDLEALGKLAIAHRAPLLVGQGFDPSTSGGEVRPADTPEGAARAGRGDAALALAERLGAARLLVLPVYEGEETAAVVVLLFAREAGAGLRVEGGEVLSTLLGETLAIQRRAHPSFLLRLANWLGDNLRILFGRTAWKLKLAFALIAVGLVVAALVPSGYRPSFTARIEAGDRRIVSAPFDGFLAEASFQPGDRVRAGDVLVALEDSEIRLRTAQITAELAEIEAELQTARAERNAAQLRLLEARRQQSLTELALLDRQLELSRFAASQDAIVVAGDAWQRVGDRVRLGEPLLELAAADSLQVLAFLDEDWVADIPLGAEAAALLTAYPGRPIPVRLVHLGADPQTQDGTNTFPARFDISEEVDVQILDGMRGVIRVDVGERSTLAAYSRGLRLWADRVMWRFGLGS